MTKSARREAILFYLTTSPWTIGFLLFTFIPMAISLYLSFTRWNVLTAPQWIGPQNYVDMFTNDPDFYQSLKVTILFTITSVPLSTNGVSTSRGGNGSSVRSMASRRHSVRSSNTS